jgi:hypothetical protein
MKCVIRLGDSTSHCGKVIAASGTVVVHGTPVARQGDKCTCPMSGTHHVSSSKVILWFWTAESLWRSRATRRHAVPHSFRPHPHREGFESRLWIIGRHGSHA